MHERGCRLPDAFRREEARGLVGVGMHLLDPVLAQDSAQHSGPRLGGRIVWPGCLLVLPVIDHIGPPLRLSRPPCCCGQDPGQHGHHRVSLRPALVLQPAEPPLDGGDPALPVSPYPEFAHQGSGHIDVPHCDGVLQRLLGQAVPRAPPGGAAPQDRDQLRLPAAQLGQQHVAEQLVVAVPLPVRVQRHQQQVRPRQIRQGRGGPGRVEHRLAQRPAHPLQHRGPGQEHPLPRGEPRQELRLEVLADQSVVAAERVRCACDRAALLKAERRQVQARPASPRSDGAAPRHRPR